MNFMRPGGSAMVNDRKQNARRMFIKKASLGISGLALSSTYGVNALLQPAYADSHQRNQFSRPFNIPPLDTGTRSGRNVKFNLTLAMGEMNFLGPVTTGTMGINSDYLGPVLRAKKGDRLSFSVRNNLVEKATLHWHGLKLPAKMDGGPHQVILPDETWKPEFDLIQPAATYWYHSHTHRLTGNQVYHGLAGLFIVDDESSQHMSLPSDYGVDDIPVIIQDRAFNRDGSFRYVRSMHDRMRGMLGNTILVNGVITPTLSAAKSLLRLRLLNGSNARIYDLSFQDQRAFSIIAGDGGFLPRPQHVNSVRLAPGERAEILLDLSNGNDATLVNMPLANQSRGGMMQMMMGGGNERFNVMRITAPKTANDRGIAIPESLQALPDWNRIKPAQTRKVLLEMAMGPRMMMQGAMGGSPFSINGRVLDMDVINFRVKKNSFEIWEVGNNSALAHPFHIHNTQFQLLARSGRAIAVSERGLKDTVLIYPQESVRLMVPFPEYADPHSPYMYHCHILEHEDGGMMGQFTVES